MTTSILYNTPASLIAAMLFVGIIIFYISGVKILNYRKKKNPDYEPGGMGALEGGLLGLLSLMLAFTLR